jgi:hypothetical protein
VVSQARTLCILGSAWNYDGYGVSLSLGYGNAIKVDQGSRVIVYCDGSDLYEAVSEGQNYTLVDQVYIKTIPTVLGGPMPGAIQPKQLYPSYLGGVGIPSYVFTGDFTNIQLGLGNFVSIIHVYGISVNRFKF